MTPPPIAAQGPRVFPALRFAGHLWQRKAGMHGPGNHRWDARNAWVDSAGRLHLRIARRAGHWTCAEVVSAARFGPGRYTFEVIAPLDRLAPHVVLGLFQYPPPDVGGDGTHEVDIELTRWGDPARPFVHYAAYPAGRPGPPATAARGDVLAGTHTTHGFTRAPGRVLFESRHGHGPDACLFCGTPAVLPSATDAWMPVHLNLWRHHGLPAEEHAPVEVVVSGFRFEPLAAP